jgi:hypothetical protein
VIVVSGAARVHSNKHHRKKEDWVMSSPVVGLLRSCAVVSTPRRRLRAFVPSQGRVRWRGLKKREIAQFSTMIVRAGSRAHPR